MTSFAAKKYQRGKMEDFLYGLVVIIGIMQIIFIFIIRKSFNTGWYILLIAVVLINATASLAIYAEEGTLPWYEILRGLGIVFILELVIIFFGIYTMPTIFARIISLMAVLSALFVIILGFSSIYYDDGIYDTVHHVIIKHDKFVAIYFSVVTITTTGYGDFVPFNNFVRAIAAIETISGYVIFGMIVASMISLFRQSVI
jgi:hypothetical protein